MTTGIFQIEGDFQKEISDEDDYEISENVSYFEKWDHFLVFMNWNKLEKCLMINKLIFTVYGWVLCMYIFLFYHVSKESWTEKREAWVNVWS